jgi:hypothetical protein
MKRYPHILSCLVLATSMPSLPAEQLEPVRLQKITVEGFWYDQFKRVVEEWIPHCIRQMEEGGSGEELLNLHYAGKRLQGSDENFSFKGLPWADAYPYNVVEAMSLALCIDAGEDTQFAAAQNFIREKLEEWIPIILAAQWEDGYIHSYHTLNEETRYTNVYKHEFYVQGYFIEMGIAHYRALQGRDRRLLDAAIKCANHLCDRFGPAPKEDWFHGHPGMGYALFRLARLVDEIEGPGAGDRYIELARYLLDNRHALTEKADPYNQSHLPILLQREAVGHAVRATYLYTAVADLGLLNEDYLEAADHLWDSAINRKMYITGGVGASHKGEAFDVDYELRNDGYCEVCAGCGMSFWADRMHRAHGSSHYVDVMERVLYNNILGALSLSGDRFYYQNPLSSDKPRDAWHRCPCCVGNIPRSLLTLKDRIYSHGNKGKTLYVNHFVGGRAIVREISGGDVEIRQVTGYPWNGNLSLMIDPGPDREFEIKIRIPDRTESRIYTAAPELADLPDIRINGSGAEYSVVEGYASLSRTWSRGDQIDISLPIVIQRVFSDEQVEANRGLVALQRGPIVYSFEEVDNGGTLSGVAVDGTTPLRTEWREDLMDGILLIHAGDWVAIPNYARLNRGGWSQVWVPVTSEPDE